MMTYSFGILGLLKDMIYGLELKDMIFELGMIYLKIKSQFVFKNSILKMALNLITMYAARSCNTSW